MTRRRAALGHRRFQRQRLFVSQDGDLEVLARLGLANLARTPFWPNPAAIQAAQFLPGVSIDDILLIAEYMPEEEIRDQIVVFLPFRG